MKESVGVLVNIIENTTNSKQIIDYFLILLEPLEDIIRHQLTNSLENSSLQKITTGKKNLEHLH